MTNGTDEKRAKQSVRAVQDLSDSAQRVTDLRHPMPDSETRWLREAGHCLTPADVQAQVDGYLVGNMPRVIREPLKDQ